jgi:diaminopimelate epimerase
MAAREFIKMQGLGNDMVIVDARTRPLAVSAAGARMLADRHTGIGFDQMIALESADDADVRVRIFNADGGEVEACGNAMRCVARLLMNGEDDTLTIRSSAGLLEARRCTDNPEYFSVDMGPARAGWQDIPLARACDTDHVPLSLGPLSDPVAVNMGNPHAVFFVDDADAIPLDELGPQLEHDPIFPERANIGVAQVTGPDTLHLRVWERGAGLTLACGSGACAAGVAAHRRGLTGRNLRVQVERGELLIEWRTDGHVIMSGPAEESFRGSIDEAFFAGPSNG